MPLLRSPTGAVVDVPDEQIGNYVGYEPVEGAEASRAIASPESEDRGVLGGVNAAATGLLSGATLGLSDYALKGVLSDAQSERLSAEREAHPIAGGAGQIAGAILPALASPGSLLGSLPSGIVGHAAADAVAAGRAIGGVEGVGRALLASGVEGAIQNAGMYLSDTALGDRELSAEGLAASLGPGFAFGVGGGIAALGIEQGTIAARRLFSRAAGTDKAAQAAESAWSSQYQSTLEANDAAADIARAKLAEAKAAREQAQLAKQRASLNVAETEQTAPQIDATYKAAEVEREQVRDAAKAQYEAAGAAAPVAPPPTPATAVPDLLDNELNQLATRREALRGLGYTDDAIDNMTGRAGDEILRTGRRAPISDSAAEELGAAVAEHDAARAELDDILRRLSPQEIEPQFQVPISEWGDLGGGRPRFAQGTPAERTTAFDSKDLGLTFDPKTRTYHDAATPWRKPEVFAPSEGATGVFEQPRPSGLEDLARMQREAGEPPTGLEGLVDAQRAAGQETKAGAAPELRPAELQPLPKEQRYRDTGRAQPEQLPIEVPRDLPGLNTGSFEDRFITAFNALDDLSGKHNNVTLGDLRAALADVPREKFDAGLRELRKSKKYSLDTFEARQVLPSKQALDGGIKEQGQNLMLVQQSDTDGGRLLPSWAKKAEAAAPASGGAKPIGEMSLDEVEKLQNELNRKFDQVPSGSREYVEASRQWDEAVARRKELATGKSGARVASSDGVAPPLDEDEFESFAKSWQSTLDPKAVEAMQTYTANGAYSHINGPLRLGEGLPGVRSDSLREAIPVLDAAIAGAPAPRDMVAFRGVTGRRSTKEWNDVAVGDSVVDRGFGSTSSMPHVGASYATGLGARPGVELRISIPKGYPAAPVPSEIFGAERELLLPRNTKYTVTKIVQHDNGRVVFVTASPAAEGEASRVAAVIRRDAKSINELTLRELEDRETALRETRDKIRRDKGFTSDEYKAANAEFERAYQRRQDIVSGKVSEPKDEPLPVAPSSGSSLLSALEGTSSKLGSGAELGKLSKESPAAAEYVSKKLAKREADAAYFRERALGRKYEGSEMGAAERAARDQTKDISESFDAGGAKLKLTTETRPAIPGGLPRTKVTITRTLGDGEEVTAGTAEFIHQSDGLYPDHVNVEPALQRQGVGTRIYEAAERVSGKKILPSETQTPQGKAFSAAFRGEQPSGLEGLVNAQRLASKDVAADEFFANLTRPKTRDAYVAQNIGRAMREEGSHAAALAKVEREWAEMSGHPVSTKAVPDAVEDVAAVAQAVTKYEKSSARLVEALGPDAPPAAQEAAKAFRQAEDHAERKTMERTTRAIDDHAEAQSRANTVEYRGRKESEARMAAGQARNAERRAASAATPPAAAPAAPARPSFEDLEAKYGKYAGQPALPPTSAEALAAAKSAKVGAGVDLQRAKLAETEAKIGARSAKDFAAQAREAAMKARPVAESAPTSTLGAIATTIGVAGELGVPGIPKPHDIPIIGPLLGTYLKYRAIKAAAGRFVGRIPATGDARAAALVARTKDKIATAVDRTLGLAAEVAPKTRGALVATAAVLGHRLIDDGEPDAPKNANAQQQAAVRIREIANAATQPGLVTALVRKELRGVTDPDLIAAAEQHLIDRFQKLNNVMPKAPPANPYSKREWVPSPAAAHEVAQRLAVVHDPEAAFHDTTPAKAQTLRDTWPRLLEFAQQRLIERVGDLKHPVPYENRLRNSLLFSVPLDDSMQPDHAAVLQSAHIPAQPAQPPAGPNAPAPSIAGNSNLTALYQTASDRRAMR